MSDHSQVHGSSTDPVTVERFRSRSPQAYDVAQRLCFATSIDPELLRRARRHFVPDGDASTEVVVWMSELVEHRSFDRISFAAPYRELLARDLRSDLHKFKSAWAFLAADEHGGRHASTATMVEEELFYLRFLGGAEARSLSRTRLEAIQEGILHATDPEDVAYWAEGLLARISREQAAMAETLRQTVRETISRSLEESTPADSPGAGGQRIEVKSFGESDVSVPDPPPIEMDQILPGFETFEYSFDRTQRVVLRAGTGPAIMFLATATQITPRLAELGLRFARAGFSVAIASLVGRPSAELSWRLRLRVAIATIASPGGLGLFSRNRTPSIATFLRRLADDLHAECGGLGVGAVGMHGTGSLPLSMLTEQFVVAPVVISPTLPIPFIRRRNERELSLSRNDLNAARERVAGGVRLLAMRNIPEPLTAARFERLRSEFGDGMVAIEVPRSSYRRSAGVLESTKAVMALYDFQHEALRRGEPSVFVPPIQPSTMSAPERFDRVDRVKQSVGDVLLPGDDRFWILGDPLVVRLDDEQIVVPAGFTTDGSSVPRWLQLVTGWRPWADPQRWAGVVHDWLYSQSGVTKSQADQTLRQVLRLDGVGWLRRMAIVGSVIIGGGSAYRTSQARGPRIYDS